MTRNTQIEQIFNKHLSEKPPVQYSNDRLLRGIEFHESKLYIATRITRIWNDIFELYGWEITKEKRSARQVNMIHPYRLVAAEVCNNWKTLNYDCKQSKFKTLKEYKINNPSYEVIFGCINDFKDRDYYNRDNVRTLTGDLFLEFAIGSDYTKIVELLKKLMRTYAEKYIC